MNELAPVAPEARKHSRLAPSSMKRIVSCRRSVPMTDALPVQIAARASVFAAEGTVAHMVLEAILLGEDPPAVGDVVRQEGHDIAVTDEMHEAAALVAARVDDLRRLDPQA